jgi:hypothetical protein
MTRAAHRRYWLAQIKHTAYVLTILAASAALCLLVCIVWKICWTIILCPP